MVVDHKSSKFEQKLAFQDQSEHSIKKRPILRSLARISWDTGVPLGGKGCFFPFITNFSIEVASQAKH